MRIPARAFLILLSLPLSVSADWNDFLGPMRNGKSQEKIEIAPWRNTGPPVVWHTRIGTSYGAPSIADGRLFIFARSRRYGASHLYGKRHWDGDLAV